jgi:hypothetical protein
MDDLRDLGPSPRLSLACSVFALLALVAACGDDGGGSSSGDGGSSGAASPATSGSGDTTTGGTTTGGDGGGTSSGGGGDAGSSSSGSCVPDCEGRACGDDGCGDACGACDEGQSCSSAGQCVEVEPGSMSFFVTSVGNLSGDFGGVDGADQFCQELADAAGAGGRTWRAYVSTSSVDARDRIGAGPWYDAAGGLVAESVDDLHASGLFHENALDENGQAVPNGKTNPGFNEHDILTGSLQDGTSSGLDCAGYTSSSRGDQATVGHCDASFTEGGGSSPVEPSDNWNSSHASQGCDQASLNDTGSTARLYCFAE